MFINELLFLSLMVIALSFVLVSFYWFRETGLFVSIVILTFLSNIQVLETASIFGLPIVLSASAYAGIFLGTNLLNEFYGKKKAGESVLLTIAVLIFTNIFMQVFLLIEPIESSLDAQIAIGNIFSLFLPVVMVALVAFYLSQNVGILVFNAIKEATGESHGWLRNNGAILISQTVDALIFIGGLGIMGIFAQNFWAGIFGLILAKLTASLISTPFFYWGDWFRKKRAGESA